MVFLTNIDVEITLLSIFFQIYKYDRVFFVYFHDFNQQKSMRVVWFIQICSSKKVVRLQIKIIFFESLPVWIFDFYVANFFKKFSPSFPKMDEFIPPKKNYIGRKISRSFKEV